MYECWRANAIEDSPSRYSQLYFDSSSSMPHAPPAQQRILEYGAVRPCCGWSQQQGGDHFLCVFDAKLKPAVFRATCLCAAQFLLIPWTIPYRISYWPNNRSAIMRIDTYLSRGTIARLRSLSIGIVINNRVRAVATLVYCATDMLAKAYIDSCLLYTSPSPRD